MSVRPFDFMESEPEVYDLLRDFVSQFRAGIGEPERDRRSVIVCQALDQIAKELDLPLLPATAEPHMAALRRLAEVLMELPSTDVWSEHVREARWLNASRFCRLHGNVRGSNNELYPGCDRLAWIGDKMLKAKYELADIWPEPGVWSTWFESSRRRH